MKCHECGVAHDDWSPHGQRGEKPSGRRGIEETYQCGHCGAYTEVARQ